MNEINISGWVEIASGSEVRVQCKNINVAKALEAIGFITSSGNIYVIRNIDSNKKKGEVFSFLRENGIAFSAGKEWSPSEVFEYLRDKGFASGSFTEISWTGNGRHVLKEK